MPGRKPKPTALKALHGNPGKRALNEAEPQFSGIPKCPAWLTKEAKREFKRILAELAAMDLLKSTDQSALSAYCLAYGRWQTAETIVSAEGQTVNEPITDKAGVIVGYKIKRHPATIIAKDERASMLKAASLFGFDPSSRSRIVMPEVKEPVEADDDFNLYATTRDGSRIVH